MTDQTNAQPTTRRPRRMAREPQCDARTQPVRMRQTKSSQVIAMLQRSEGATLDQLVAATGWLPHTTRAALTGLKKRGHVVSSDKVNRGVRVYRVARKTEAGQ